MTPFEIVIDTCKRGGFPLSEEQAMLVGGSVAFLVENERQDEREACAQVCEAQDSMRWSGAADAIRARGGA